MENSQLEGLGNVGEADEMLLELIELWEVEWNCGDSLETI
jgi:hypothetical protein